MPAEPTKRIHFERVCDISLEELFPLVRERRLFRRWGVQPVPDTAANVVDEMRRHYIRLRELFMQLYTEGALRPRAVYGLFPCWSEGESLIVFASDEAAAPAHSLISPTTAESYVRFHFPSRRVADNMKSPSLSTTLGAQSERTNLAASAAASAAPTVPAPPAASLAAYFASREEACARGRFDVFPAQVVSVGAGILEYANGLYAQGEYRDYFLVHGLAAELTEVLAAYIFQQACKDLDERFPLSAAGMAAGERASSVRRYSFGYPACPDLAQNGLLLRLLGAERIGVTESEIGEMLPELSTSAFIVRRRNALVHKSL